MTDQSSYIHILTIKIHIINIHIFIYLGNMVLSTYSLNVLVANVLFSKNKLFQHVD